MLRPRYRPGWKPSWVGTNKSYHRLEDGQKNGLRLCMDATRISDGRPVMLKRLVGEEGPYELQIDKLFSTEPLHSNPRNHHVQLLGVIELPNNPPIMVHPLLRPFYKPPFQTFGKICHFLCTNMRGECYGVPFMHENNVAHRDCTRENIMLDPSNMYPESFHAKVGIIVTRQRHIRGPDDLRGTFSSTLVFPANVILPTDHHSTNHCVEATNLRRNPGWQDVQPVSMDVYYLGNLVQRSFMQLSDHICVRDTVLTYESQKYHGFEFMEPLIADMVQSDPTQHPKMDEVVDRFFKNPTRP
ncbi:hypothetical protein BJV74DRAFT_901150 [Russula compacta]|nr:hypothetical protein BJV74DRAFT_901150 [Russula compacta]